ncbi:MAG: LysR family transcriptional regulator [Synergistaceae bacterium]|nr:LysR family transcriptional regulator [Synergistaceae bacterium]MBQ6664545.1 LysR family transcriptional regulator [Synergistaceae bacterium]MBR0248673.1 LysR family transcriptional regulator [Synergistaceae bacterium]
MQTLNPDYFLKIVECGSLTKAAEELIVSQPSLSQYIRRLERSLDAKLFDRKSSPMKLTYTGERYYQYALKLRDMNRNMRNEIADIQNQTSGRLKLGVTLWRGACLLPDIYPEFNSEYPNIKIELFEGRFNRLQRALMNNMIDIAVAPMPRSANFGELFYETLLEERIFLAVPSNHPYVLSLNGKNSAGLDIFSQIPLIITKPGQNLTYEVESFFAKNHVDPIILFDTDNLTTAINLVAEGIACTFVPEEGAKICRREGRVTFLMTEPQILVWDLVAVYKKGSYLNNISRTFIDFMKRHFSEAKA